MNIPPAIFRFAPSPNGRLHLGHAYSALLNARLAERMHGRFLVRVEDIDTTRCTAELAQHCLEDLAWLGLSWEAPVRVQSEHWADYQAAAAQLQALGLLYPCFCTRKEVAEVSTAQDPDGAPLYAGTCHHLTAKEVQARMQADMPYALRLDMAKAMAHIPPPYHYPRFSPADMTEENVEAHPARWGDVVLVRKETPTSYHLAVVVDDALQGVTHVVRGVDLEAATDVHVLLQRLLGLPTPRYYHHPLITEPAGEKLAKSRNSESLADLRARGVQPQDITFAI
jgi:glutamyl-Q tRNA(Asp) synthetase